MVTATKKTQKIGRVLRTAARPLIRVAPVGKHTSRIDLTPIPGEQPIVLIRIQVLCCEELLAKDRNGTSDPFVVVSLLGTKQQTPVIKKSTNPVWSAKDATFDFPIYLSLADKLGALELLVWDKDVLKKDYLGEHALPLEDWFKGSAYAFDDPDNEPITVALVSTRAKAAASGRMRLKLGFVQPPGIANLTDFAETFEGLVRRSRPSLVSAPPTEGIGTIRSHATGPAYEDDGLSSDEEGYEDEDDFYDINTPMPVPKRPQPTPLLDVQAPAPTVAGSPTPTSGFPRLSSPAKPPSPKPPSPGLKALPKILRRPGASRSSSADSGTVQTPPPPPSPLAERTSSTTSSTSTTSAKKKRIRTSWASKPGDYDLNASNDVVGIVMLEIDRASDLPKFKNMTRTGWDMDPFVVISFGKKVFRTRVIRHSLNPVWDEKMLFHVRKYERSFSVQLSVLDWDKISANDHIGDASFNLSQLMENVPKKDPSTGLYPESEDGSRHFTELTLPLQTVKESVLEPKYNSTITIRAKYQPYDALRQQFWYQLIKQYDTDDTRKISHLELTSMLDSLGSTLSTETIQSFWTRYGKSVEKEDELTFPEVIMALEATICRPVSEKKRINPRDNESRDMGTSTLGTPNPLAQSHSDNALHALEGLSFAGPGLHVPDEQAQSGNHKADQPASHPTEGMQTIVADVEKTERMIAHFEKKAEGSLGLLNPHEHVGTPGPADAPVPGTPSASLPSTTASSDAEDASGTSSPSSSNSEEMVERVINVKNCPLCHRPRMNKKAERDIVTHLAVCASSDWARVDRVLVGNFVTASQAQRKWYTRVFSKGISGDYKLGANSANIIVQNRMTGQLEEEKMQVYVRLGIRLLYKGARSRLEGARARRMLKSMSIKQGIKYDAPSSIVDIRPFIEFHNLNTDEIALPLESYKTFNEFFYRKLKPDARPVENADDPNRIVSAADCRLMAFHSVNEATRLWIKGREFSVARLLGDAFKGQAERYHGGALVIFRLAPQDYHRFHSPVDGTIGAMSDITGEYYTVNPQAIRTTLDVYGENVRKIVPIDSPQFGRVIAVCIGAMMVGSIKATLNEGDQVKRGQEFGYFAFGGSTIVMLFEPGVVEWDEDLAINGRASLETLVRVGMGIGWRAGTKQPNRLSMS